MLGGPLDSNIWIVAHQYGWDEALLFVIPIAIAIVVVRRLDKREKTDDKSPPANPLPSRSRDDEDNG